MWPFQVEIEHYFGSVKNKLTMLIKALGLLHGVFKCERCRNSLLVRVALPTSAFTLGYYNTVPYTYSTRFNTLYLWCAMATNTSQTPTVRGIL